MKKLFISSDIHSFYDEWMDALHKAGFDESNANHIIVVLGDLLDRGPNPYKCLEFVNSLPADRKILIRGNHEDLIESALAREDFSYVDYHNGTAQTILDIAEKHNVQNALDVFRAVKNDVQFNLYINSLVDYYEVQNCIFVHGWIPCKQTNGTYSSIKNWKSGNWYMARWINGMAAWDAGVRFERKTIYCGHWHSSWGHHFLHNDGMEFPNRRSTNPEHRKARFDPFIDKGIVAVDACTAFSHTVNCVTIELIEK